MNYKEKYKQALDNFKKIKAANKDNKELVDFIEYEYPELKESEEEGIIKALIHYFSEQDGILTAINGSVSVGDILAWLKKQGKQKSIDKVEQEEDVELTDFESALFSAFSDAWQEYLRGEEVNVAKWAREHSAELLEVAREQKPAWSEEDEKMLQKTLSTIRYTLSIPADKEDDPCFVGSSTIAWLKSIKDRMKGE